MPKGEVMVKAGWEHRAFLGPGPFTEQEFAAKLAEVAAEQRWSEEEAAARAAQAYAGTSREEVTHGS